MQSELWKHFKKVRRSPKFELNYKTHPNEFEEMNQPYSGA
jgi:hypothetical protein